MVDKSVVLSEIQDGCRFYRKNQKSIYQLKYSHFSSVTTLQVCFRGQGIHFCSYFSGLTKFTRNGGQKYPFLGSKWSKLGIFQNLIKNT